MNTQKGFTLIELLVVIGIISLLSSVVFASVTVARAKANDARKKEDVHSVQTALSLYHTDTGSMPKNYLLDGQFHLEGGGNQIAIEDSDHPDDPQTESGKAYKRSMEDLVNDGKIAAVPHSPGGSPYAYFNYGPASEQGAMFGSSLQSVLPTTESPAGSCRYTLDNNSSFNICDTYNSQCTQQGDCGTPPPLYCTIYYPNGSSCRYLQGQNTCPSYNFCAEGLSTDYCVCNPY